MESVVKTVCFTGHRNLTNIENIEINLKETIKNAINNGYYNFMTGGALGFDELAANTIISLKNEYPQIKLILVLPFLNPYEHEKGWQEMDIEKYNILLEKADEKVILNDEYKRGCYYQRDRYLVDNSSLCISYQTRKKGGTAYTVDYANKQGLQVINLAKWRKEK